MLQEILCRYHALGRLDLGQGLRPLVALVPVVLPVTLADTDPARDFLVSTSGISARRLTAASIGAAGSRKGRHQGGPFLRCGT